MCWVYSWGYKSPGGGGGGGGGGPLLLICMKPRLSRISLQSHGLKPASLRLGLLLVIDICASRSIERILIGNCNSENAKIIRGYGLANLNV